MKEIKLSIGSIVHLNNFIFLVFAHCTWSIYKTNECVDERHEKFLLWMYLGNLYIYSALFCFTILH